MKLSTRVRFAVRIMMQVAAEAGEKPVLSRNIAASQEISEPYVDQILLPLRSRGLLLSVRGRSGGYRLARPAREITLLDIVQAMEGTVKLTDCVEDPKSCNRSVACATREVWTDLTEKLRENMRDVTLDALVQKQAKLRQTSDYAI